MTVILYAALLGHFMAYKEQYANIGVTFAMTYVFKKLIKSMGSQDQADLIGLGGYTLSIGEFVKLLKQLTHRGFDGIVNTNVKGSGDGLLADMMKTIISSLKDNLTIHN